MARVTSAEVLEIIEVDPNVSNLTPFITAANLMVTEILAADSTGLSTAILKEIERWLSAHFVAIRDPRIANEKAGPVAAAYAIRVGQSGLDSTPYGAQAMALDHSGNLRAMNSGKGSTAFGYLGAQDTATTSLSS